MKEGPAVAAAFTRPVFRDLANGRGLPEGVARTLTQVADPPAKARRSVELVGGRSLGRAFDAAFGVLGQRYRCEYYYKAQIVSKVVFGRHSPRTATPLIEFAMGAAIADLVVVNGTTSVYEIKTDLDNFDRLEGQLDQYGTRAEFTNVVVSERRAQQAVRALPEWVGVLALRRNGALATLRAPRSRLDSIIAEQQFHLLRTDEARRAVALTTGRCVDAPTGAAYPLLREAFAAFSPTQSNAAVVAQLRNRGSRAAALVATPGFPASLRALAYAQPLSGVGARRLVDALVLPVRSAT
ncbi:sce7726 family protein [Nocardioides sp. MH1]|uniref:sce7726 family protein n=1 Tax=Nocardioides sp. MH1 TaxID=3242490 RepID=UPI0035203243